MCVYVHALQQVTMCTSVLYVCVWVCVCVCVCVWQVIECCVLGPREQWCRAGTQPSTPPKYLSVCLSLAPTFFFLSYFLSVSLHPLSLYTAHSSLSLLCLSLPPYLSFLSLLLLLFSFSLSLSLPPVFCPIRSHHLPSQPITLNKYPGSCCSYCLQTAICTISVTLSFALPFLSNTHTVPVSSV